MEYSKSKSLKTGEKYLYRSLGIGSQISQISGLYFPHEIDNYCKIVRGIKFYGRYMDDTYIISNSKEELRDLFENIKKICNKLGIFINSKKTHIFRIDKGFTFLKINYRLTETGHLVRKHAKSNIVRQRRKLKSFKKFYDKGEMDLNSIKNQYESWRGNILKYDSHKTILNMDKLYNDLFKDSKKGGDKMRLIELYYNYKKDYKNYVIFMETGIFYDVYNSDVGVMNKLLNYKIKYKNPNYIVGFPTHALDKVLSILKESQVNYIVLNKDNSNFVIKEKFESDKNKYEDYEIDFKRLEYLNNRINQINTKLLDNVFDVDIESVLSKIEKII